MTVHGEAVLRLRVCLRGECGATFFLCPQCDHGQRYCSPECREAARRLRHCAADAKYQKTPHGARQHAHRGQKYRDKKRAHTEKSDPEKIVTDPPFSVADSPSSCGGDDTPPTPQPQIQPLPTPSLPASTTSRPISEGRLRCQFCGCRGYLQKRHPHEPDHPARHP